MSTDTPYRVSARSTAKNRRRISYSEIASLSCFRKHHLSYNVGLRPVNKGVALRFGTAYDDAMNVYYDPEWNDAGTQAERVTAAIEAGIARLRSDAREVDTHLLERGIPRPRDWQEKIDEHIDLLVGMVNHFAEHYGDEREDWITVAVQVRFEVPFPSANGKRASTRYWLHGVVDRVMEHRLTGAMYVVDTKTAAGIDDAYKKQYDLDRQLPLYGWALRELGWPVVGHMIDVSAKKVPRRPKVTKRGKLEKLIGDDGKPRVRTTPALVRAAIAEAGLDPAEYADDLRVIEAAHADKADNPYFWRKDLELSEIDLTDSAENLRAAATIIDKVPNIAMPSQMGCSWCDFRPICKNPDPEVIATEYTTREDRRPPCQQATPEPDPVEDDDPLPF